ncbi:MAG: methyltransferase domain-containing protein [Deltaproteobacteria bacterium]|nr:methyltransferase domain-containing protein [Deltaproteobacteria bacterium]
MNEQEALAVLTKKSDFDPELMPFLADLFLNLTVLNPIRLETARRLGPILDLRPGQRVLDLACGKAGVSLPLVYTYKVNLVGVDLMPDFIREAWSRAEHAGLLDKVQFILDDGASYVRNKPSIWEAVLIIGALPFLWADMDQGLTIAAGLVKPGGHLVIGLPYLKPSGKQDPGEPLKSKDEITSWLAGTGQVVEILDDGDDGWKSYIEPQKKAAARLNETETHNEKLRQALEGVLARLAWEADNRGYALWVIKI